MRVLDVIEGQDFQIPPSLETQFLAAIQSLEKRLKPSFRLLSNVDRYYRLNNVIGSIEITRGFTVNVNPKVDSNSNWIASIFSLLTGEQRIELSGDRLAGVTRFDRNFSDALASIYADRLERAFRRDGPILRMEQEYRISSQFRGRLHVSQWVRSAFWNPHEFPTTKTTLSKDSKYTPILIRVAQLLSAGCQNHRTKSRLAVLQRDLAATCSLSLAEINQIRLLPPLPDQWAAYKPAWAIAQAVLSRASLLGPVGVSHGLSIAIEAWPLLETLLNRTLKLVCELAEFRGKNYTSLMKGHVDLLSPVPPRVAGTFRPEPDGRIFDGGIVVASFEAKYKNYEGTTPPREDIYQALSTAAACDSPLSILIYPQTFAPFVWEVSGFNGRPQRLAALGIGLFNWLSPSNRYQRAESILRLIAGSDSNSALFL